MKRCKSQSLHGILITLPIQWMLSQLNVWTSRTLPVVLLQIFVTSAFIVEVYFVISIVACSKETTTFLSDYRNVIFSTGFKFNANKSLSRNANKSVISMRFFSTLKAFETEANQTHFEYGWSIGWGWNVDKRRFTTLIGGFVIIEIYCIFRCVRLITKHYAAFIDHRHI